MGNREDLFRNFHFFAASEDLDVFEGALLVAALVDPAEDLPAARAAVASLASRVRELVAGGDHPVEALCQVLFTEEGMRGDQESYDEPGNSSVARVLVASRARDACAIESRVSDPVLRQLLCPRSPIKRAVVSRYCPVAARSCARSLSRSWIWRPYSAKSPDRSAACAAL